MLEYEKFTSLKQNNMLEQWVFGFVFYSMNIAIRAPLSTSTWPVNSRTLHTCKNTQNEPGVTGSMKTPQTESFEV